MKAENKKQLNILLADDDEDDQYLFSMAVEKGFEQAKVTTAGDGQALMKILKEATKKQPDIIFLDLNMPRKNGKECLEEIRANKNLAKIPVVIYSTSVSKIDVDETYKSGANLYLEKPSDYNHLIKVLPAILKLDWQKYFPSPDKELYVFTY